jgi:DnaJ-class molecular chaperone
MNEGMPHGNYQTRGDMIIHFRVKFPESHELPPQARDYLKVLLPSPPHSFDFSDVPGLQHAQMFDMPPSNFDTSEAPSHNEGMPFDPFGIYQNESKMNFESTSEH